MPSLHVGSQKWTKTLSALALSVTALGAVLAAFWGLSAALWTYSTQDYGSFVVTLAITSFLIGTPLVGFKVMREGKPRRALALTVPALLIYGVALILALRG